MKKLTLFAALALVLVASGCGDGGDPAANADKAPEGAPPSTTPVPTEPGKPPSTGTPQGRTGTSGATMGRT